MIEAAREEMLSGFGPWCADLPLAADLELSENSRRGVGRKNPALHLGQSVCNSTTALGIERGLFQSGIGSRIQTWNRYASVNNNPMAATDPTGLLDNPVFCPASIGACGGGGDAPTYVVDGIETGGGIAQALLNMGAAAVCPDNDCSPRVGSNGYLYRLVLDDDGFNYVNPLNGNLFENGSELGLPSLEGIDAPDNGLIGSWAVSCPDCRRTQWSTRDKFHH
jgi:hypothetical protein